MRSWRRRRRDVACRDAVALMTAYLDDALDAGDRERLEAHLTDCPHCWEYLAQLRVTIDLLGRAELDALPEHAVDDFVALYHRWREG